MVRLTHAHTPTDRSSRHGHCADAVCFAASTRALTSDCVRAGVPAETATLACGARHFADDVRPFLCLWPGKPNAEQSCVSGGPRLCMRPGCAQSRARTRPCAPKYPRGVGDASRSLCLRLEGDSRFGAALRLKS
eukprot:5628512-Pleurochrysis_carterae.AAC.2